MGKDGLQLGACWGLLGMKAYESLNMTTPRLQVKGLALTACSAAHCLQHGVSHPCPIPTSNAQNCQMFLDKPNNSAQSLLSYQSMSSRHEGHGSSCKIAAAMHTVNLASIDKAATSKYNSTVNPCNKPPWTSTQFWDFFSNNYRCHWLM